MLLTTVKKTEKISGNNGVVGDGFSEFQMGLVTAACALGAAVFAFCIRPKSGECGREGSDYFTLTQREENIDSELGASPAVEKSEGARSRVRQSMLAFFGVRST